MGGSKSEAKFFGHECMIPVPGLSYRPRTASSGRSSWQGCPWLTESLGGSLNHRLLQVVNQSIDPVVRS